MEFLLTGESNQGIPKAIPGALGQTVRVVGLGNGAKGYLVGVKGGSIGQCFRWNVGGCTYMTQFEASVNAQTYASVVRSLVRDGVTAATQNAAGQTWLSGNACYAFRGAAGRQRAGRQLQSTWWNGPQTVYNGNYSAPAGGSTPSATQDRFDTGVQDMSTVEQQLDDSNVRTGIEWKLAAIGVRYHMKAKVSSGPFNSAISWVFGAAYAPE